MATRKCNRCGNTYPLNRKHFYYHNKSEGTFAWWCIGCRKEYAHKKTHDIGDIGGKICSICKEFKPTSIFTSGCKTTDGFGYSCQDCKDRLKEKRTAKWLSERPEYYAKNKERILKRDSRRVAAKLWMSRHYNNDDNFRLCHLIRTRIYHAYKTLIDKGYYQQSKNGDMDFEAILVHLGECPGSYGMGVGKYSIDHIIPLRWLDLSDPIEWKIGVDPKNHRWLLWEDNYKRRNEITAGEARLYEIIRRGVVRKSSGAWFGK